jgi:hypothetical protein
MTRNMSILAAVASQISRFLALALAIEASLRARRNARLNDVLAAQGGGRPLPEGTLRG